MSSSMATMPAVASPTPLPEQTPGSQKKCSKFCEWVCAHKKAIAIALIIIGLTSLFFGLGGILAAATGATVAIAACAKGVACVGLVINKGLLVAGAIVSLLGLTGTAFGVGVLACAASRR